MSEFPQFACPVCRGNLAPPSEGAFSCEGCGTTYPQTLGIPDLRGPGHEDAETDRSIARLLLDAFDTATYDELLAIRVENAPTYGDLIGHEVDYLRGEAARGRLMIDMFHRQLAETFGPGETRAALDLGCGTGTSIPILAERYDAVLGLDPSLPELILAKKYLAAAGVQNARLVQAYGQRIPVQAESYDSINALNVLEHVFELGAVLDEIHRVLGPGGRFSGDSRNRFDLFTPEPHVKIRWVGLLPRRLAPAYVRLRRGVGYETTRLLSYGELKRGLQAHFGTSHRVTFPKVQAYGFSGQLDPWIQRLAGIPGLRTLALWVFPSHLALAMKSGRERGPA